MEFQAVMAVLVLIVIGKQLSGVFQIFHLWKTSKWDLIIWLASFISTTTYGITYGLGIGIIFQVFTVAARTQWWVLLRYWKLTNLYALGRNGRFGILDRPITISTFVYLNLNLCCYSQMQSVLRYFFIFKQFELQFQEAVRETVKKWQQHDIKEKVGY